MGPGICSILWSWLWHHLCAIFNGLEDQSKRWQGKDLLGLSWCGICGWISKEKCPWHQAIYDSFQKHKEKSIEALFTKIFEHVWNGTQKTIPFAHWVANWTRDDQKNSYLIDAIVSLNTICFRWNVYFVEVLFPVYHDKDYNVLQMNLKFVLSKYCNFINLMKW